MLTSKWLRPIPTKRHLDCHLDPAVAGPGTALGLRIGSIGTPTLVEVAASRLSHATHLTTPALLFLALAKGWVKALGLPAPLYLMVEVLWALGPPHHFMTLPLLPGWGAARRCLAPSPTRLYPLSSPLQRHQQQSTNFISSAPALWGDQSTHKNEAFATT